MAKAVTAQVKIQIPGGQATPAPPVGTALGPHGVNIGKFVQEFNARTADFKGMTVPAVVTIFNDRSFEFILKSPPASVLLKEAAKVAKGASNPKAEKVGTVTMAQVQEIAKRKFADLNAPNIEAASKVVAGTARSMGITVTD